jgi:hypothetical protein
LSLKDNDVPGFVRLELGFCVLEKLVAPLDIIGVEDLILGAYELPRVDIGPINCFPLERMLGVPRCRNNELEDERELSKDGKGFRVSWSAEYDNTDSCGLCGCSNTCLSFSSYEKLLKGVLVRICLEKSLSTPFQ